MKKTQIFAYAAALAVSLTMLTACGGKTESTAPEEPTEVRLYEREDAPTQAENAAEAPTEAPEAAQAETDAAETDAAEPAETDGTEAAVQETQAGDTPVQADPAPAAEAPAVQEETAPEELPPTVAPDVEVTDAMTWDQVEGFTTNDPKYDPDKYLYEFYIEKVLTSENGTEEIIVVCARTQNLETEKISYSTIAAVKDFYDSDRPDGPELAAREEWYPDAYTGYSAEAIIQASLTKYAELYGDAEMQLYEHYILASTFE